MPLKGLRVYMFTNGTLLKGQLLERIAASALIPWLCPWSGFGKCAPLPQYELS